MSAWQWWQWLLLLCVAVPVVTAGACLLLSINDPFDVEDDR